MHKRSAVLMGLVLFLGWAGLAGANTPSQLSLQWPREAVRITPLDGGQVRVEMQGGVSQPDPGSPDLPWVIVQVPASAVSRVVSWGFRPEATEHLAGPCRPTPTWLDRPEAEGGPILSDPDPAIYTGQAFYPSEQVRFLGLQSRRGQVVALFQVCPFQWDPLSGELSWSSSGVLEVTTALDGDPNRFLSAPLREEGPPSFSGSREKTMGRARLLYDLSGDRQTYARPSLDTPPVEFLIVTDTTLVESFQPLLDWKNRSGSPAAARTVQWIERNYPQGVDLAEKIRLFLKDAYSYWGTKTVLLGADPSLLPIRYGRSYFWCPPVCDLATDYYYACLDGSWNANGNSYYGEANLSSPRVFIGDSTDLLPELRVGRVSARSPEQVEAYLNKYMKYVRNPDRTSGYLDSMLVLGEVLFDAGWQRGMCPICGQCGGLPDKPCPSIDGASDCLAMIDSVRTSPAGAGFGFVQLYERFEYWNDQLGIHSRLLDYNNTRDALNHGVNVVYHMGHGDRDRWAIGNGRLLVSDVLELNCNGRYSGLAYVVNCNSAAVDADCVGEAWHFSERGGGLDYIGSTNLDFPGAARMLQDLFFAEWLSDAAITPGDAYMEVADSIGTRVGQSEQSLRFLLYSLIFLGDPDMPVWKTTPGELTVDPLPDIYLGGEPSVGSNITVHVRKGIENAIGAKVCLYKDGEAMAVGVTGADGRTPPLSFRPTTTGRYRLTVTHPLAIPYEDSTRMVQQMAGKSFVAAEDYGVNDGGSEGSLGNGNGQLEMGETVSLSLSLSNEGSSGTSALALRLRAGEVPDYPWLRLEVVDSVYTATEQIGAGQSQSVPGAFLLRITQDPDAVVSDPPARITLPLTLVVEDGAASHTQELTPELYRPNLLLIGTRMRDTGGTSSNGLPNDGETIRLVTELYNRGGGTASHLRVKLRPVNASTVSMQDSMASVPDIPANSPAVSDTCRFRVITGASSLRMNLLVEDTLSTPPRLLLQRTLSIYQRPIAASGLGAFGSPSSIKLTWTQPDSAVFGFRIYRTADTTGTWNLAGSGFVENQHTFTDEGLPPLVRYYYRIVGVTRSGMESPASWSVEGSTSPGLVDGWPNYIVESRDACPAFEHLQPYQHGGVLTVLLASDLIYAFKADGSEYLDGDRVPSTRGPLIDGSFGQVFYGKVAVADIDGDGKKEIIAGARQVGDNQSTYARLLCLDNEGRLKWYTQFPNFQAVVSTPAIGDIDGDGEMEIVVIFNKWVFAFEADGTPFRELDQGELFAIPGGEIPPPNEQIKNQGNSVALADVDEDGMDEIIFTTEIKDDARFAKLYVLNAVDGTFVATHVKGFPYRYSKISGLPLEKSSSSPAVGDVTSYLDGATGGVTDGHPDIIVHTRTQLWVFDPFAAQSDTNRVLAWHRSIEARSVLESEFDPLTSSPALGDIDGDGHLEIVVGGNRGTVYAFDGTGTLLPGFQDDEQHPYRRVGSTNARLGSPILADVSGDHRPDVIVGDNEGKVYALKWDGTSVSGFPYSIQAGKIGTGLSAWDMDNDGYQNLVIQADKVQKIQILDFPNCPFDSTACPWPQFRHDARNTGFFSRFVVTPVEMVTLSAEVSGPLSVELRWENLQGYQSFSLERRLEPDGDWQWAGDYTAEEIQESPGSYRLLDQVPQEGTWSYHLMARDLGGSERLLGEARVEVTGAPAVFRFDPAQPNPFSPETWVRLQLPRRGPCEVVVTDAAGRIVRQIHQGVAGPGVLNLRWDGADQVGHSVGSGVYFIRVQAAGQGNGSSKVIRLK